MASTPPGSYNIPIRRRDRGYEPCHPIVNPPRRGSKAPTGASVSVVQTSLSPAAPRMAGLPIAFDCRWPGVVGFRLGVMASIPQTPTTGEASATQQVTTLLGRGSEFEGKLSFEGT